MTPLKYGDAVVYVKKLPDGTICRVNAIVLRSLTQSPNATRPTGLRDAKSALLTEGEYLDLLFPNPDLVPEGQTLKMSSPERIFLPAWSQAPWKEGAWSGWQPGSTTPVAPDPAPAQPTEEDLDAHVDKAAEEARAKALTTGKVRQIKGK